MSILLTNALISISSTPPSYGFASFANTYLGISGGFGVVLFLAYLFETRSPRRGVHQLVKVVLSQMSDWMQSIAPADEQRSVTASQAQSKQLVASLGKLKKVAAQVDYGQCPSVDRETVASVAK